MTPADTTATLVAYADEHTVTRRDALVATLIDTVGVAIAGRTTFGSTALERWLEPSTGEAPVWGSARRVAPTQAALVNGTAAHALDFDDAGLTMPLHPSAVLWPAVLAAATPETGTERLLAAVEAGQAVFRAVADILPMGTHYGRGWHSTSTIGRLAATLACARVRGLDAQRAAYALGIASSTAAGSLANFGSMTKPLHVGFAARDAVTAVGLAAAGITANPRELDDDQGFLARYGAADRTDLPDLAERLAYWSERWPADTVAKQFPSCFGTHRAIAATLRLLAPGRGKLARTTLRAEDVARVDVEIHPATLQPLLRTRPTTGDEAKFSLEFCLARTLQTGGLGLADFTTEAVADPRTQALADLVHVTAPEAPSRHPELAGRRFAQVTVTTVDGTAREETVTFETADDRPDDGAVDDKLVRTVAVAGHTEPEAVALREQLRCATSAATAKDLLAAVATTPATPAQQRSA